jgi:hypothetical protein
MNWDVDKPSAERLAVGEGKTDGRGRLFLCIGWEFEGVVATRGSKSHGDTLSGRKMEEGSSQWTWQTIRYQS